MSGLLPMLVLLPFVGGCALLFASQQGGDVGIARRGAILIASLTLLLSILLVTGVFYHVGSSNVGESLTVEKAAHIAASPIDPAIVYQPNWLSISLGKEQRLQLCLGVDGIGALMGLLTSLLVVAVLMNAMIVVKRNYLQYAAWILVAESGLLLTFSSMDVLLFYLGFELTLVPLLVLISLWGDGDSRSVANRFVLFTLAGSIPMIVALIAIVDRYANSDGSTLLLEELAKRAATDTAQTARSQLWMFGLLVFGLGIKMGLLPLHAWLPATYSQSHPSLAALLAGVVSKLGIFGFIRILIPLLPAATAEYGPTLLGGLGSLAIVYGALAALVQTDLRRLLAYSSLSHVGFITVGLFALNQEGIAGAVLQMFNHGLTTAAMFLLASSLIARRGSANLNSDSRGLARLYPRLGVLLMFFTFAGAGMPGLNNFVGELMALSGMMLRLPVVSAISVLGVVLGAWYALLLVRNLMLGSVVEASATQSASVDGDLKQREWMPLAVFATLAIAIGCVPNGALRLFDADARGLASVYEGKQSVAPVSTSLTNAEVRQLP